MSRIKEHITWAIATSIAAALALMVAAQPTEIPRYNVNIGEVHPDKFGVTREHPQGQFVLYTDVEDAIAEAVANCAGGATTDWFTDAPTRDESTLLCEIRTGVYGFRDYINGQWRVGANAGPAPLAWAKIIPRVEE